MLLSHRHPRPDKVTDLACVRAIRQSPVSAACAWSETLESAVQTNLRRGFAWQRAWLRAWGCL